LKECDLLLAEDTRNTKNLLSAYDINKTLVSFEKNNAKKRSLEAIEWLGQGKTIGLVTDAGTPGISDPGFELVSEIRKAGLNDQIMIIPIPGASALTAALSSSGMDASEFYFGGFLPSKASERKKVLTAKLNGGTVLVFFESPHRIIETLEDLKKVLFEANQGDREIYLVRELTKMFETHYRGTIDEVMVQIASGKTKGEWVIVVGPIVSSNKSDTNIPLGDWRKLKKLLDTAKVTKKDQIEIIGKYFGLPRNVLYKEIAID
jgi:16S rRNA (cytidine1402-2'-O)-methyltransferase